MEPMELAEDIAATIHEWLPGLRVVDVHPGPFTEDELRRLSTATPACYVSWLGTAGNANSGVPNARLAGDDPDLAPGRRDVNARYLASILCRAAGANEEPDRQAARIGSALLERIPDSRWGVSSDEVIGGASGVDLANQFSEALAAKGMALWTVQWTNEVRLGSDVPGEGIPEEFCIDDETGGEETTHKTAEVAG